MAQHQESRNTGEQLKKGLHMQLAIESTVYECMRTSPSTVHVVCHNQLLTSALVPPASSVTEIMEPADLAACSSYHVLTELQPLLRQARPPEAQLVC
jgi:hypothetical protein